MNARSPRNGLGATIVVLLSCALLGCNRSDATTHAPGPVTIIVSGDTAGWITPCGCSSNHSGGLLRRGTYLLDLRRNQKQNVIYVDAGGAIHGSSDYDRLKFQTILAGERLMGLNAHNIGRAEAALGADALRTLCEQTNPLVSCNVRDTGGQLIGESLRIVPIAFRRIGITGVLSQQFAQPGLRVDDPRQSVLKVAADARGVYDVLIVLAYLPQDELEKLAASLPEADVVVGGPTGQPIPPHDIGPTLLTSATNKGKFLAVIDLPASGASSGSIVELNATFADEGGQKQNLDRFLGELGRRDFAPSQTGLSPLLPPGTPADYRIAGSESCARCHAAEFAVWRQMDHAHAWQTLAAKHFEVDPECMQCHTTGYGLPGGFATRAQTMERVSVGCESCHGPAAAHVADPHRRTPFKAADQCTQCHDHENSPRFEFASYWAKIRHGPTTRPAGSL